VTDRHAALDYAQILKDRNRCGGITYKFCVRVEMMSSVAD
jgi:hypothetical protein